MTYLSYMFVRVKKAAENEAARYNYLLNMSVCLHPGCIFKIDDYRNEVFGDRKSFLVLEYLREEKNTQITKNSYGAWHVVANLLCSDFPGIVAPNKAEEEQHITFELMQNCVWSIVPKSDLLLFVNAACQTEHYKRLLQDL